MNRRSFTTDLNEAVAEFMRLHKGRKNAVKSKDLAAKVGADERSIRDAISYLVEHKGMAIGSHPAVGYFMIADKKDKDLACRHLKSRGVKILKRLSIIENKPVEDVAKQLSLLEI